ncbi:helix-turn-helix domain-containing protein [Miltoncostaea oceani]|uniref:helix-turn-helix domain-containing protein n=1 Tax=Miltoncostaea oceani TaxID=2843216 RepID=UPI001C3D6571|nr:helix-turn-helix transcriptional regulator [Miltoncostaea oceani]
MGRGPQAEQVPNLAHALRYLRGRATLTQARLAERVRESGGSLSTVYYQQIESGLRFPSPPMRARLLAVLGSDEAGLTRLLAERPWERTAGEREQVDRIAERIAALSPDQAARLLEQADQMIRDRSPAG